MKRIVRIGVILVTTLVIALFAIFTTALIYKAFVTDASYDTTDACAGLVCTVLFGVGWFSIPCVKELIRKNSSE